MVEINLIKKGGIHILLFYWTRSFIQIKDSKILCKRNFLRFSFDTLFSKK
ncbi:hypothetical protein LEP1GSC035_1248 [Leptospira noguchii str. 2007001578]|uniref:Uncharacterized protein n=2 Tax=Leptospira noguchii TaxID=28182 RepID=M6Y7N3_9LEPT|nr:hypothetical protein LEP1GSC035_1248 [Leptospira noguchii str. 2007001578]EMO87856.1 hypothetical protein LEP1GSC024_3664 [Leptospira noguchii str. 2001034031]